MTTNKLPTIAAAARATKSLATCARLLVLAGLEQMLQGEGRYTLFAPTDLAFDELRPEAMAALERDPTRLRAALDREVRGATRIVVAQRVSTILDADQIVVLEDGAIVGIGTHAELLETSEEYAEIVASQLSIEEAA